MCLELQVKISRQVGVPLVSRQAWSSSTRADRRTTRRKQSQEKNRVVMKFYQRSEYGRNGYKKRIHAIQNEMEMFNVTEQRLVDQKSKILKGKRLLDLKQRRNAKKHRGYQIWRSRFEKQRRMRDGSYDLIMKGRMCL